jgi:methylthioribose-1-phosphate isomerase
LRQRQEVQTLPREIELKQALQTIAEDDGAIVILDQTRLPSETAFVHLHSLDQVADAIRSMQVRGAPLIGATAAYGVAIGLADRADDVHLQSVLATLAATRPTAVNLHWALSRMERTLKPLPIADRAKVAWQEARVIANEDIAANASIGRHGLPVLLTISDQKKSISVMTHCNAGWLATVAHGTALSPVYAAHESGVDVHVWVSETRPRNQGLLTAWELEQSGVPHTLIADNAAGLLLMQGKVDVVIVGADRIAANGDTANKIGTYLKALAAKAHGVPFYVAAPMSTIDFSCADGQAIPIEERDAREISSDAASVANPAFDITPAALITGIVTERGIHAPSELHR